MGCEGLLPGLTSGVSHQRQGFFWPQMGAPRNSGFRFSELPEPPGFYTTVVCIPDASKAELAGVLPQTLLGSLQGCCRLPMAGCQGIPLRDGKEEKRECQVGKRGRVVTVGTSWKSWNLTMFGQILDNWYVLCCHMPTNKSSYCMPLIVKLNKMKL